jgi:4-amino-4-deoxy-L-arabinose transferase-like glycosyltransferase
MKKVLDILSDYLWGESFSSWYLIMTAFMLMFFFLGGRDLWTQETRWANICQQMILRQDYFHPFLNNENYYDKPLLSYWMMIGFSYIFGMGRWALRTPGVIAGLVSIWCSFKICEILSNKRTGVIAAWMLATTIIFVYWSRVACADMLNVGGILLAVTWFLIRRDNLNFFTYFILFLIVTVDALCKGLTAPIITFLILLPILLHDRKWKEYFKPSMFIAAIIMGILYVIPFIISSKTNGGVSYQENGLYEVFRENIVRYFKPFDHTGPVYTYLLYLPLYSVPWIVFTIIGIYHTIKKWKSVEFSSRFYVIILALVFIFFTCSGSRRSYYVLPMVPLAIFIAANWINSNLDKTKLLQRSISFLILIMAISTVVMNIVLTVSEIGGGTYRFANDLRARAGGIQPLDKWNIVFIGVKEDLARKTTFYFNPGRLPDYNEYRWDENSNINNLPFKIDSKSNNILIIPQNSFIKYIEKSIELNNFVIVKFYSTFDDRITGIDRSKNFLVGIIPKK